jgi:cysteinyl-tRNA synthetase
MRILEDEWKAYDTVTAEDLCVGRFMRLFKEVSSLEYIHAHCQPYLTEDLEYMVRLIDRVVEGKKNYMSSSGTLMLLIRSIRNKLERMLL